MQNYSINALSSIKYSFRMQFDGGEKKRVRSHSAKPQRVYRQPHYIHKLQVKRIIAKHFVDSLSPLE